MNEYEQKHCNEYREKLDEMSAAEIHSAAMKLTWKLNKGLERGLINNILTPEESKWRMACLVYMEYYHRKAQELMNRRRR